MSISMEVQGLAELKRRLEQLPQAIQSKIMRGAVSTAAAVFREEAERHAPEYTGTVQNGHPPPGTLKKAIYQVRVREECFGTREAWKVSVKRGKRDGVDAYYGSWVEYGTVHMVAHPYMRPAFELQKENAVRVIGTYIAFALPQAVESIK